MKKESIKILKTGIKNISVYNPNITILFGLGIPGLHAVHIDCTDKEEGKKVYDVIIENQGDLMLSGYKKVAPGKDYKDFTFYFSSSESAKYFRNQLNECQQSNLDEIVNDDEAIDDEAIDDVALVGVAENANLVNLGSDRNLLLIGVVLLVMFLIVE